MSKLIADFHILLTNMLCYCCFMQLFAIFCHFSKFLPVKKRVPPLHICPPPDLDPIREFLIHLLRRLSHLSHLLEQGAGAPSEMLADPELQALARVAQTQMTSSVYCRDCAAELSIHAKSRLPGWCTKCFQAIDV